MKVFQNGDSLVVIISGAERVKRMTMSPENTRLEVFPSSYYSSLTTQAAHLQPIVPTDEERSLIETELCHILMSSILDCVGDGDLRTEMVQTIKQHLVAAKAKHAEFVVEDINIPELAAELRRIEQSNELVTKAEEIKVNALKSITSL